MAAQPIPYMSDEQARLECLRLYAIMDTPREPAFDRFVFIAAQAFRAPFAMLNLVDATRLWSKARVGRVPPEIDRAHAFDAQAILSPEPLVIQDASLDARFKHNPMVMAAPFIRFYAGAPLIAPSGARIGSLCVMDSVPRSITPRQVTDLALLAREAMVLIDDRRFPMAVPSMPSARAQA